MTTASGRLLSGAPQFARYAFPPNELGYCGPAGADVLLEAGSTEIDRAEIASRARLFDGAWVYLEIIAAAAGIEDPLDSRVVEAYWIGNDLLDRVEAAACGRLLRKRFAGQITSGLEAGPAQDAVPAMPHHSFHVFTVYPWVMMLAERAGTSAAGGSRDRSQSAAANAAVPISVLDRCRIRWGEVTEVDGDRLQVLSRPLRWDGAELSLGPEQSESVRWSDAGRSLLDTVRSGQQVALHWDWACDLLSAGQLSMLELSTRRQLEATNHWLASAPARRQG